MERAKLWKEPRCPSTDEWIRKMWCIYTMIHYAVIKKDVISPFMTTWMDLEGIMVSEESDLERQIPYDYIHMESKNKTKQNKLKDTENKLVVARSR